MLARLSEAPSRRSLFSAFFFFFNDTATTEIYTLSLHDALPILEIAFTASLCPTTRCCKRSSIRSEEHTSELQSRGLISYAVFCLKKSKRLHLSRSRGGAAVGVPRWFGGVGG